MTGIGQADFLQALGWAVLNSLWQMALLWVIYQLFTAVFKSGSSQKSLLATILLLTGFTWFVYTFFSILSSHSADTIVISSGLVSIGGNEQLNAWMKSTLPVASLIYLFLLILPLLQFVRNYRYVQVIRHGGLSKINAEWRLFVQKLAAQMGITKPVYIWLSEFVSSPVTIGYLKPVILVPLAAINHLTPQQLEAVLLHELSHIKRYDYLINLIINFIQTILYFNPFVKAFVRTVEREREKSCDEMVMQFQYDPYGYASALVILEKNNHLYKPLAVAAAGKKNDLLHRVELILGIHKRPMISFNKLAGLFAGLLCVIALNAVLIMTRPADSNRGVSFTHLSSPFYFFTGDNSETKEPVLTETKSSPLINTIKQPGTALKTSPANETVIPDEYIMSPSGAPAIANASFDPVQIPQLNQYQEEQVKEAIDSSKKIIEDVQWKTAEKNIAEVLNQKEKDQLRSEYQKALDKLDWKKWEDNLRIAFDKVDWEKINEQLGKAVTLIRLDSLQKAYTQAIGNLDLARQELSENNLTGIPDTDITLKEVEQKKQDVQKSLNKLRVLRNKKIVHL